VPGRVTAAKAPILVTLGVYYSPTTAASCVHCALAVESGTSVPRKTNVSGKADNPHGSKPETADNHCVQRILASLTRTANILRHHHGF
jgi:hypothetical protein